MTRIAPGTGTPNQPSVDGPLTHESNAASGPAAAADGRGAGARGGPTEVAPDRPATLSGRATGRATTDPRTFLPMLKAAEGETRYMYLDTRGLVTTGIGHMLKTADAATKLPWHHKKTGLPATPAEVKQVFDKLRTSWAEFRHENPKGPNTFEAAHYEKVSDLELPEGFARQDALARLQHDFLPKLRSVFPGFDSYPMPAQKAIVDMAYNLGIGKLRDGFPKFVALCRDGEFGLAAPQSHRSSSRADRNAATAQLLVDADQLKKSVRAVATEVRP